MAKWLLVVNAALTMFIPLLTKTENIVFFFFLMFTWCESQLQKIKKFYQNKRKKSLWFTCIAKEMY